MMQAKVAVVVLNYNGKHFLDTCFQSLQASTYKDVNYYLLDNASTQPDVTYVKETYPWVKIIQNSANNGYCAAYNLALQVCTEPYLLCLNNDVLVSPNWLEPLIACLESNPKVAAVQPKLLDLKAKDTFEYAGASGGLLDRFGFPFMRGRIFGTVEKDIGQYNKAQRIFWASGACLLLRKSVISIIGGFDEIIVHHMDEIDLCWRLHLNNYEVWAEPTSYIYHYGGATIITNSYKKTYWNHRNALYLVLKNYSLKKALSNGLVHILLANIACLQSLITLEPKRAWGILMAQIWVIGNLPLIIKKHKESNANRKCSDRAISKLFYPRSIVWDYYINGYKKYSQLKLKNEN